MDGALFFPTFVGTKKRGIMEENNAIPNTGAKGVFPGSNQVATPGPANVPGAQNQTGQPAQTTQTNPPASNFVETIANAAGESNTYIKLETKNPEGEVAGVLEIDLISFRERGQESRYLSINTVGATPQGEQSDTTISINNEADFMRFKNFIEKLNWND